MMDINLHQAPPRFAAKAAEKTPRRPRGHLSQAGTGLRTRKKGCDGGSFIIFPLSPRRGEEPARGGVGVGKDPKEGQARQVSPQLWVRSHSPGVAGLCGQYGYWTPVGARLNMSKPPSGPWCAVLVFIPVSPRASPVFMPYPYLECPSMSLRAQLHCHLLQEAAPDLPLCPTHTLQPQTAGIRCVVLQSTGTPLPSQQAVQAQGFLIWSLWGPCAQGRCPLIPVLVPSPQAHRTRCSAAAQDLETG